MGPSALRWIPAGVATGCALLVSLPATSSPVWRSTLSWVLLASIAITSAWAPSSRFYHPDADRGPRPELVPLAQRLQNLVAPAEKVVVEERIKCHTILFYGRRAILFFGDWLLNTAAPGESRYGIFQHLPPEVPGVSAEILQTSGSWHLLKLTVLPSDLPWAGILLARTDEQQGLSILLSQMGVETEPFAKGFVLRRIPVSRLLPIQPAIRISNPDTPLTTAVKIPDPFVVPSNGNLVLDFESPTPCSGVDLIPDNRRQPMEGWKFEYRQGETNNWILLRAVDSPFPGNYAITGRRLERTMERGLRLRFQAIPAKQWRITRTASTPVKISTIRCYGEP